MTQEIEVRILGGEPMKTYICDSFEGFCPIGTAAVVRARNEVEARKLLNAELQARGLNPLSDEDKLKVVPPNAAIVICDGNY